LWHCAHDANGDHWAEWPWCLAEHQGDCQRLSQAEDEGEEEDEDEEEGEDGEEDKGQRTRWQCANA
jgi:hypothetical protein